MNLIFELQKITDKSKMYNFYEMYNGKISDDDLAQWILKNPDFDLGTMNSAYEQKYPLIQFIKYDYYHHNYDDMFKGIFNYINLIDSI
jgi:hypothetical protein